MKKMALCHPELQMKGRGLCDTCYRRELKRELAAGRPPRVRRVKDPKTDASPIRVTNPKVAAHVATVALKHQLDMEGAVREMRPGLNDKQTAQVVRKLESEPQVKEAIEKALDASGLDDSSKAAFVRTMWEWLRSDSLDLKKTAAGILGRGFISERAVADKPMTLTIEGYHEGLSRMGLSTPSKEN